MWRRVELGATALAVLAFHAVEPRVPEPAPPSHGPVSRHVATPEPVQRLLRRACYDCHSAHTRWPWYSRIFPASWLIARHVREGRASLDFSDWGTDPEVEPTPRQRLRWTCEDVREGVMPPFSYRLLHPEARLGAAEKDLACAWAVEALEQLEQNEAAPLGSTWLVTEPAFSPDGATLAFAAGVWPSLDIWLVGVDGSNPRPLTTDPANDYMPTFAPDGSLVFASNRTGSYAVYRVRPDSGDPRRLTPSDLEADEPHVSADGAWLAFRGSVGGNRDIYVASLGGDGLRRLTDDPAEDGEPAWSPDGERLLFTSTRSGVARLYLVEADGRDLRPVETGTGAARRASWSPDGCRIAFGSDREGNDELYVMALAGGTTTNVSRHPAREYFSRWSPDGRSIAFQSNRDREQNALYVMAADGSGVERVTPPQARAPGGSISARP